MRGREKDRDRERESGWDTGRKRERDRKRERESEKKADSISAMASGFAMYYLNIGLFFIWLLQDNERKLTKFPIRFFKQCQSTCILHFSYSFVYLFYWSEKTILHIIAVFIV